MILVDSPPLQPGHCVITHSAVGPFVDTGIDFDDLPTFGRLYIGKAAVETMAGLFFGMVPAERLTATEDQLAAAQERITELEATIAAMTDVREAIDRMNGIDSPPIDVDPAVIDPEMLDELAKVMPPPDSVDGIMDWVDADPTEADLRRLVAVHVEKRNPEHRRRKTIMALAPQET